MAKIKFIAIALAAMVATRSHALTGSWRGDLAVGQMKIGLVFNFSEDDAGATSCAIDSPSQGAKEIPTTVKLCEADSISIECRSIGASFEGKINSDSIVGTFNQRGYSFPLILSPERPIEERRPQTPKPPFPYQVVDTTFTALDGAVMNATLTMPLNEHNQPVPVVLMVTGSGPQNRDEEIFDHRPFAVIADYLARAGIGSLRYDDRGTAKSTGNFSSATTMTFKDDALSGLKFLRSIPSIGSVGVLGYSEGGTIAFMLGAEGAPDFIISLAGMAESGKETMLRQNSRSLDRAAMNESDKQNALKLIELTFDAIIEQNREGISRPIDIDSILSDSGLKVNSQVVFSVKMAQKTRSPWLDVCLGLDPRQYLTCVKCPVLALHGAKDTQVDGETNLSIIKSCSSNAKIILLPDLNHLMQHCVTGESDEYAVIRETISPEVLQIIADFIKRQK